MKIAKLTYGLMAATMFSLASCDLNDYPEFSDGDAFVAIQVSSATLVENDTLKTLEIPVMLTSLSGIAGSVDFTITPDSVAGAVEGTHYTLLNETKTLSFSKENPTQSIKIMSIDNKTFGGDTKFTITLSNPQGAVLGANKTCVVTVADDEHPLAFILGDFAGKGASIWASHGEPEWTVTFSKDPDDLTKVWITNLVPNGSSASSPVYGVVNEEKTEIHIPVDQVVAVSSSYPKILLHGFYGDHSAFGVDDGHTTDGDDDILAGEYITGLIAEDGTITIIDYFGSEVFEDDAASSSLGWYEIMTPGTVLKK